MTSPVSAKYNVEMGDVCFTGNWNFLFARLWKHESGQLLVLRMICIIDQAMGIVEICTDFKFDFALTS